MTEHRPECYERFAIARTCVVCDALRACEARMRLQAIGSNAQRMLIEHGEDCWRSGYAKALDAAREAVLGAKAIDVAYGRGLDEPAQFIWLNQAGLSNM